jgi:hypothetical protein
MNIKFSHNYPKLWGQKKAELIGVRILNAQAINKDLIEYDTKTSEGEYYELPKKGELIQLVFVGDKDIPFCTLRRYTEVKYLYYSENVGNTFDIVIEAQI